MANLLTTTIDGSITEKKYGFTGTISHQQNVNSTVVFNSANHGLPVNQPIVFTASTGTNSGGNALLPGGVVAGTTYYVQVGESAATLGLTGSFCLSTTPSGSKIAWASGFQGSVASPGHTYSAKNILNAAVTALFPQTGANTAYTSNTVTHNTAVYNITSGKVVVAYIDTSDSSYGKAVVGTVTGDTIAFGTPANFSDTTAVSTTGITMATLPGSAKVVIGWSEGSATASNVNNKGTSKVGTISGTTISFGAEATFEASTYGLETGRRQWNKCMVSDTTSNRVLLAWKGYGATRVTSTASCVKNGTTTITTADTSGIIAGQLITGTGILGSTYVSSITNATTVVMSRAADDSSTHTLTFTDSRQGWASCGTVSGTTVTWNTPVVYEPQNTTATSRGNQTGYIEYEAVVYDATANKFVIAWEEYGADGAHGGRTRVGTIDGSNNITFGTVVQDSTNSWDTHAMCYHAAAGKIVHVYRKFDTPLKTGFVRVGTISGTTITYGTESTFPLIDNNIMSDPNIIYHADTQKVLIVYASQPGTDDGHIKGIAGTVTGTSISLGNAATINDDNGSIGTSTRDPGLAYDTVRKRIVLSTNSVSGTKGEIVHFDGANLTVDLATGNFFEVDFGDLTQQPASFTISNSSSTHVSSFLLKIIQGYIPRDFVWDQLTAFKWDAGTAPTLTIGNDKIDILSFITYDNGTTWHGTVVGQNYPHETTPSNLFGERGVFGGHDDTVRADIEYITISTLGNGTFFGNLSTPRSNLAGCSNGSRGVFCGGTHEVTNVETNIMEYITISTLGNATNFGDLTVAREFLMGAESDGSRGVIAGGDTTAPVNVIDYITIATTGDATDFGDLILPLSWGSSCSDGVRAVFAGGNSSATGDLIEYITIATLGNGTNFVGTLTAARVVLAGISDGHRGVFGGGANTAGASSKIIDYINISTLSNALGFGDLNVARRYIMGTSNGSRGVFAGGVGGASGSVWHDIEYITISTPNNASKFGDLNPLDRDSGIGFSGN